MKQTRSVRGLSFRQLGLRGANDHLFAYLAGARTLLVFFLLAIFVVVVFCLSFLVFVYEVHGGLKGVSGARIAAARFARLVCFLFNGRLQLK